MKQTQNAISKKLVACATKLAGKSLTTSANSTSCGILYQPKAPKSLKSFRKF